MKKVILILLLLSLAAPGRAFTINWSKTNGPNTGFVWRLYMATTEPSGIYAVTYGNGLFKSDDYGATWTTRYPQSNSCVTTNPGDYSKVYSAPGINLIYSSNAGATFGNIPGLINPSLPGPNAIDTLAVDPKRPSKIYATQGYKNYLSRLDTSLNPCTWETVRTFDAWSNLTQVAINPATANILTVGISLDGSTWIYRSTNECKSMEPDGQFTFYPGPIFTFPSLTYFLSGPYLCSSTNEGLDGWKFLPPSPFTQIQAMGVSPTNPNVIYAVLDYQMKRSLDGGTSWTPAYTGLPDLSVHAVSSIIVSPTDQNTAYAATNAAGMFKTTDGGISWSSIDNGFSNCAAWGLDVDPRTHWVYAGTATNYSGFGDSGSGLWRSKDKGANWESLTNGLLQARDFRVVKVDRSHSGHIYAGGSGIGRYTGMYKSLNGGDYWTAINDGLTNRNVSSAVLDYSDPVSGTVLYVGTKGDGVFKGVAADVTGITHFSQLPTKNLTNANILSLTLYSSGSASALFAGTDTGGVFKFNVTGESWDILTPVPIPGLYKNIYSILVMPNNPRVILAGTDGGLYRSNDGGSSWSLKLGLLVYSFFVDKKPAAPTVYAATQTGTGTIYKSEDGSGEGWAPDPNYDWHNFGGNAIAITNDDVDYTFYVSSGTSGVRKGIPNIAVPPTPSFILGTAESASSIRWAWENVAGEIGYRLYDGSNNLITTLGENRNSYLESGLSPNNPYTRNVTAFGTLESAHSSPCTQWTWASAPTNLRSILSGGDFVRLNWDINGNPPYTHYFMEMCLTTEGAFAADATIEVSSPPYQDFGGLYPRTPYRFRVSAVSGGGITTEPSNIITESTTHETRGPKISNIRFDGIPLLANDPVKPFAVITADLTDETVYPEPPSPISKESVTLNFSNYYMVSGKDIDSFVFSAEAGVYKLSHKLRSPLGAGTYQFYITAADELGNVGSSAATAIRQIGGSVQVLGTPLSYPTPFKPLDKTAGKLRLSYTLSKDSNITFFMYDVGGRIVLTKKFLSGSNGGRTGYNDFEWDGMTDFGATAGNGIYVYKIISGGKAIGTGKIVVYD